MLLRFRCIGALSLTPPEYDINDGINSSSNSSSNSTGTKSTDNNKSVLQQHCLGIRSRLLPLGEYPTMTAHDALQNFAHASVHNRSGAAAGFGGTGTDAGRGDGDPSRDG